MATKISGMINNHMYPTFYYSYPWLIRLHHYFTFATTLRNWYVKPVLDHIIKDSAANFVLYDAGCGAGDFILPLIKKHKESVFVGADKLGGNINLCNSCLKNSKLTNGKFIQEDIENYILAEPADIAICITVLQYCNDDNAVLHNIFNSLKPGGILLLYVPVNYKRFFRWYNKLTEILKDSDYDSSLGIKRHYSPAEIKHKVISAGFFITRETTTYKTSGKISFELFSGFLNIIKASPRIISLIIFPVLIIFYPLILVLMILDLFEPGKNGNGILIKACKNV